MLQVATSTTLYVLPVLISYRYRIKCDTLGGGGMTSFSSLCMQVIAQNTKLLLWNDLFIVNLVLCLHPLGPVLTFICRVHMYMLFTYQGIFFIMSTWVPAIG